MIPKPYYQDEHVTLYCGDCREILPELKTWDCVVTSPPYNTLPTSHSPSGLHAERASGVNQWIERAARGYFDTMPEGEYQEWMLGILEMCFDRCRGLMWVNHKIRYRDGVAIHPARILPWPIYSEVIWDRGGSMALNCKRYAPSTEHLIGFGSPYHWDDRLNKLMSVWRMTADKEQNDHPCAFPLILAERPIVSSTVEGDIVLDPFSGSGTTMVAAYRNGRRGIGIEKEERFCAMAVERLRQGVLF